MPIVEQVPGHAPITEDEMRAGYTDFELDRMNASRIRSQQRGKGSPEDPQEREIRKQRNSLEDAIASAEMRGLRSPGRQRVAGVESLGFGETHQSLFNRSIDQFVRGHSVNKLRDKISLLISRRGMAQVQAFVNGCPHVDWIMSNAGDLL